jgi:hypothetical protein
LPISKIQGTTTVTTARHPLSRGRIGLKGKQAAPLRPKQRTLWICGQPATPVPVFALRAILWVGGCPQAPQRIIIIYVHGRKDKGKANGSAKDASSHGMESSTLDRTRQNGQDGGNQK